jgi:hypothetical protein
VSEHALLDTPSAICAFYDDVKGSQAVNIPSLAVACGKPVTSRNSQSSQYFHKLPVSCLILNLTLLFLSLSHRPLSPPPSSPISQLTSRLNFPHHPVSGHVIFVYKRLRPYYKFALPMQPVDPAEADVRTPQPQTLDPRLWTPESEEV